MQTTLTRKTTPNYLRKYLSYTEIDWGILGPEQSILIERSKSLVTLRRNEILFDENTSPKGVYMVNKGMVKLYIRMPDGAEQIVFLYTPGEVFGFRPIVAGEKHPAVAAALEPTQLEFIPAETFLSVLDCSEILSQTLLRMLCHEFTIWINRIAFNAQKDVKQRMALVLLVLNEKFISQQSLVRTSSIHVSKTELASMVGTSLETVIRTLKKFTDQSLVRITGKHIVIRNQMELIRIAGIV
jgi:CRP-like cAMP-binding protein